MSGRPLKERAVNAEYRARMAVADAKRQRAEAISKFYGTFVAPGGYDSARGDRFNTPRGFAGIDLTPDQATLGDLHELRRLTRDAARNNPIARGIVRKQVAGAIGTGVKYRPAFRRRALADLVSDEDIDAMQEDLQSMWDAWAGTNTCDAAGRLSFPEIQCQHQYLDGTCGESFQLFDYDLDSEFGLALRVIHPMQVDDPTSGIDNSRDRDVRLGVSLGPRGEPIAYFVRKDMEDMLSSVDGFERIEARVDGRPLMLHMYDQLEPGQTRGVPEMATILRTLKNFDRVSEANVIGEMVRNYFTSFIITPNAEAWNTAGDEELNELLASGGEGLDNPDPQPQIRMGPGAVNILRPGEDVKIATHQSDSAYEAWATGHLKILGMSQQIPHEVMMDAFQSSYSASRAARLSWRKRCETIRARAMRQINQPTLCEFIYVQHALGNLNFPGYWDDPRYRRAYEGAQWDGDAIGLLDPKEETKAAKAMIDGRFSTHAEQTSTLTGGSWRDNAEQLAEEKRFYEQLGLWEEPESTAAK